MDCRLQVLLLLSKSFRCRTFSDHKRALPEATANDRAYLITGIRNLRKASLVILLAPKQFFVAPTPVLDGAEMAYLIAAQYGIDTFKGMLDDSQNRELRIRHFFSSAGPEVGKVGFSVATGEIFVWVEVKKVQTGTVELTVVATGAFDRGLVTFYDNGQPHFSVKISDAAKAELRWKHPVSLTDKHRERLTWHRERVFQTE